MVRSAFSLASRALRHQLYNACRQISVASLRQPYSISTALPSLQIVARSYSSAAPPPSQPATPPEIAVPIRLHGLHGKYATALFRDAVRSKKLEQVEAEIKVIIETAKQNKAFRMYLIDPLRARDESVKAVIELSDAAGFSDVTKLFLAVVAEAGKMQQFEKIAAQFLRLTKAHKGEVDVVVTSVIPLPKEEEKELIAVLNNIAGPGKSVNVQQKVDPRILGGLVIEFEDKIFDVSIKRSVDEMTRILNAPLDLHNL